MTLLVRGLRACYGKSEVLHGVRLEVAPGEIVALLGRNGAVQGDRDLHRKRHLQDPH